MSDFVLEEDADDLELENRASLLLESSDLGRRIEPHGRRPIGVNQPPGGGSNYPLVLPSDDVEYLFADFYLSYPDPFSTYSESFSIAWLFGFGDNPTDPPGWAPEPIHDYDMIVKDSDGNIVFDSTQALSFYTKVWGGRLLIIEWKDDVNTIVCRCTIHIAWSQQDVDANRIKTYDTNIAPTNAVLDPRTCNRLPLRVNSIRFGLNVFNGAFELESGYNIGLQAGSPDTQFSTADFTLNNLLTLGNRQVIQGTRFKQQVLISANPGDGLGQVPGCQDSETTVKVFGGARPDSAGNINLDMDACLRTQRPVGLVSSEPRHFQYLSNTQTPTEAKATIEIHDDCGPCCDCDFFVRTYKGLKRQWNFWQGMATQGQAIRDQLVLNRDRWLAAKDCRESNPLRVVLLPEPSCKVVGGAMYCNASTCCLIPLQFRFTFEHYRAGVLTSDPDFTPTACEILIDGSPQTATGEEGYVWAGQWPVYDVLFDYGDPQDTSRVSFRLCMPDCNSSDNIRMTVAVISPDPDGCVLPVKNVPDDIDALWHASGLAYPADPVRALMASKLIPLQSNSAFCSGCKC